MRLLNCAELMRPGLNIYTSNRLEVLSQRLAEVTATPLPDVFQKEIVIVQSRGMARWLNYQIAQSHDIAANIEFPFPRGFAYKLFSRLNAGISKDSPWDPGVLLWRVMRALPPLLQERAFFSVNAYQDGESSELRLYQLASRIAQAFDQYIVFRPDLVRSWDKGGDDHWQALLWRALAEQTETSHPAILQEKALHNLIRYKPYLGDIPPRISVFGISALPKFYLDVLAALAGHRQVNLFLLQPTQESWDHITSKRESEKISAKAGLTQLQLHLEEGHPLLASWGSQGREFFRNVLDCNPDAEDASFIENESSCLLHQVQDDILHLRSRSNDKGVIEKGDTSIQVHSCHSALRELEVLRDQMLAWFQNDPTLHPRDILVMMPNVESYTPLIQAVFDVPEKKREMIPFSIADRSVKDESQIAETLLHILSLSERRCSTREIITLLDCRSLLARFEIAEADLELIHRLVLKAGIRWGMNAKHRASFDLPAFDENCWETGMDRLLLGYAMLGDDEHLFEGKLPVDEVEGANAEVLGRFAHFIQTLFSSCERLTKPRTLTEWSAALQELLNTFFVSDANSESELINLRSHSSAMAEQEKLSGFSSEVPLNVFRAHLKSAIESSNFSGGFLDGGVTFCALKPMRSLPFKVICLLGMNDTAFPRQNSKIGFDLLQQKPRQGDPSNRKDDQYLFLESLLAARDRLHVSYIGQSVKDNKPQPPSVLVSELIDHVQGCFEYADGAIQEADLILKHRLQAFSPEYFRGERLFTFSQANARALKAQQRERVENTPFISEPLPEPEVEFRTVSLSDLADFFAHPAKQFLRKRMRLELARDGEMLEEVEPFEVSGLDTYKLKQDLLERELEKHDATATYTLLQARGILPFGRIGENSHRSLCAEISEMATQLSPHFEETLLPIPVDLHLADFFLSGELQAGTSGLLQYRCAKVKGGDILRAWINHLALNAMRPANVAAQTVLVGSDSIHEFGPVPDAESILQTLLQIYWRGMCEPLKFFPNSSFAYAMAELRPGRRRTPAMRAAEDKWYSSKWNPHGEGEDAWFRLCFQEIEPLDTEFTKLSLQVFQPLFCALKSEGEVDDEL